MLFVHLDWFVESCSVLKISAEDSFAFPQTCSQLLSNLFIPLYLRECLHVYSIYDFWNPPHELPCKSTWKKSSRWLSNINGYLEKTRQCLEFTLTVKWATATGNKRAYTNNNFTWRYLNNNKYTLHIISRLFWIVTGWVENLPWRKTAYIWTFTPQWLW